MKIRNYSEEKVGMYEPNDFYASSEMIYHVVYDEYRYPYLVEIIDRLLNDEEKAIDEIINPNFDKEQISIDKMIIILNKKYKSIPLEKRDEKRDLLDKLRKLSQLKELNKNQVSVIEYYSKVRSFIKLELIDYIDISIIDRVNKFNSKSKTYIKK